MEPRNRLVILLIVLGMVFFPSVCAAEQRIVVGLHENAPLIFTDADKAIKGLAVDILTDVAGKEKWRIQYLPGTYAQCIRRLAEGTVNVVPGVAAPAPPDERFVLGDEAIVDDWGQLYVASGNRFADLLDLQGKTIAAAAADPYAADFAATLNHLEIHPRFITVADYAQVFSRLRQRQAAAGIVSRLYGARHARRLKLNRSPICFNPQPLRFAVARNLDAQVGRALDRHLKALKTDSHSLYYRSLDRWALADRTTALPGWLRPLWVLAAIAVVMGTIILGNIFLRRQVKLRTEALQDTIAEKEKIESELAVARDIQLQLVPGNFPVVPRRKEFDIHASLEPAHEVGGDFYDFFFIDRDSLCLVVGDVSGKGVPAALFMAMTKTMIKSAARLLVEPEYILADVNREIARKNPSLTFVTVFLGVLDLNTGCLTYTSAGHIPQLFVGSKGNSVLLGDAQCPAIGLDETYQFRQSSIYLQHGEGVLLFTDGVTEARAPKDQLFTQEALMNTVSLTAGLTPRERIAAILSRVREFTGNRPLDDDLTLLALTYFSPGRIGDTVRTIDLKNDIREMDKIMEAVTGVADAVACPPVVLHDITLAIEEIFSNIVFYGFGDELEHRISLQLHVEGDVLILTLVDEGIPFNPLNVQIGRHDKPLEERDKGGMGIILATNLMDRMEYRRERGKNILCMEKRFR
ncbi:MAG TPA: SpoIIE family protein phosphatase [Desulfosarcina sp.]|nr:SpoIIE family protein phosphatase [Desulfosarcina sp.]